MGKKVMFVCGSPRKQGNTNRVVAWVADVPDTSDKYLAVFNTRDKPAGQDAGTGVKVPVKRIDLHLNNSRWIIRDLWKKTDLGQFNDEFAPEINWHGAGLYRVSMQQSKILSSGRYPGL